MLTACCYRVAYFTSATDTTANDNRFTTVVVNINGEADVAVPSRRMFISTCTTRRTSRSERCKYCDCRPEQSDQCLSSPRQNTKNKRPYPTTCQPPT